MNVQQQLLNLLDKAEPNILGNRFAEITVDGVRYSALSSTAGSHQSGQAWGRIDYRANGKRVSKANLP